MEVLDAANIVATSLLVYRQDKSLVTIGGANLTFEVVSGSLIISNGGQAVYAFNPGQWATVNSTPV